MKMKSRWLYSPLIIIVFAMVAMMSFPVNIQADKHASEFDAYAEAADFIIVGQVDGKVSCWNEDHTRIISYVNVQVEESLKGSISGNEITITVPGGEVGGITQVVTQTPSFSFGERMVVLLSRSRENTFEVFGYDRSKYTLGKPGTENADFTLKDLEGLFENKNSIVHDAFDNNAGMQSSLATTNPVINSVNPSSASAGTDTPVTITGSGFGSSTGEVNFFYRSGQPAIEGNIVSWSDTNIVVTVPVATINNYAASASSGWLYVKTSAGYSSSYYAFAVTFSYGGVKWAGTSPVVKYYVNPNTLDITGEELAVQAAANSWNSVAGSNFRFNYAGTTSASSYGYNSRNEIMWTNLGTSGVLARAIYWYTGSIILETDIELNDYYSWSTSNTPINGYLDVQSICTHEMGHWLNLRDLYGNLSGYPMDNNKVMYGFGSLLGNIKRTLSSADQAGIIWIYAGSSETASITMKSPDGGEIWHAGRSNVITWSYSGNPGSSVKLQLYKSGTLEETIVSSTPIGTGGNGSYSWYVPESLINGSDYKVKITSLSDSSYNDYSNSNFSIVDGTEPPGITVTLPYGGETWQAGTTHTITWSYTGHPGPSVNIELYRSGSKYTTVVNSTSTGSAGNGFFNWEVPSNVVAGSTYLIKVASTSDEYCYDFSNYFTISAADQTEITVTSPGSGDNWQAGTNHIITWSYTENPGPYVSIQLYKGSECATVVSSTSTGSGGSGSYVWAVPESLTAGSTYRIKVTSTSDTSCYDYSSYFTISAADVNGITVTSPNGGETWQAGATHIITWSYSGNPGPYVEIQLYIGGSLYSTMESSILIGSGDSGYYIWAVPESLPGGSTYRVKIHSTSDASCYDYSDGYFTINAAELSGITVTSPDSGETWQAGTTHNITWSYSGNPGPYVKVQLFESGSLYTTLESSTPIGNGSSGYYTWAVPESLTAGSAYAVKISSTGDASCYDYSDYFSISAAELPEITVTSPWSGETWQAGTTNTIAWSYSGDTGPYVRLMLYNSGKYYMIIESYASIGSGGNGSYTWTLPDNLTAGSTYSVKIYSINDTSCYDCSDYFNISAADMPEIAVTSPIYSDTWQAGTNNTLTWSYTGNPGPYVNIQLYRGGSLYTTVASSTPIGNGGNGSYTWAVPGNLAAGNSYAIKIYSTGDISCYDYSDYFNISAADVPEITVTSPCSEDTWQAGTTHTITWSYSGDPGSYVRINLYNNGNYYKSIVSVTSIGSGGIGLYIWELPGNLTEGSGYAIKVYSPSNSSYYDYSDYFTINAADMPEITVTSPNGEDAWQAGTTHNITWSYNGDPGDYVRIFLYSNERYCTLITSSTSIGSGGNGSYQWAVPASLTEGSSYAIKIYSAGNSSYYDYSDYFIIGMADMPEITVTSPCSDDTWQAGTTNTISWSYKGDPGSNVRIQLYNNGKYKNTVTSSTSIGSGGNGSYNWALPVNLIAGSGYTIKVYSTSQSTYYDYSDYFSLAEAEAPTITLESPGQSDCWQAGTTNTISWSFKGDPGSNVRIQLYNNGRYYSTIVSSTPIGSEGNGSYIWAVPGDLTAGSSYTIKIYSTSRSTYYDYSDYFSLTEAETPTITFESPRKDDIFQAGAEQEIVWSYSGDPGPYVRIHLYKNGRVCKNVVSRTSIGSGGEGSYKWNIPSNLPAGDDYSLKVYSATNSSYCDYSGYFSIN